MLQRAMVGMCRVRGGMTRGLADMARMWFSAHHAPVMTVLPGNRFLMFRNQLGMASGQRKSSLGHAKTFL